MRKWMVGHEGMLEWGIISFLVLSVILNYSRPDCQQFWAVFIHSCPFGLLENHFPPYLERYWPFWANFGIHCLFLPCLCSPLRYFPPKVLWPGRFFGPVRTVTNQKTLTLAPALQGWEREAAWGRQIQAKKIILALALLGIPRLPPFFVVGIVWKSPDLPP